MGIDGRRRHAATAASIAKWIQIGVMQEQQRHGQEHDHRRRRQRQRQPADRRELVAVPEPWPRLGAMRAILYSSRSVCACSHQPSTHQVGRRLDAEHSRRAASRSRKSSMSSGEQVGQPDDAGLGEQRLLGRAEVGQVEQQRLVAPVVDVVGRGVDLVGQVLAPRRRLRDLEQQAGREDALALEAPRGGRSELAAGSRAVASA